MSNDLRIKSQCYTLAKRVNVLLLYIMSTYSIITRKLNSSRGRYYIISVFVIGATISRILCPVFVSTVHERC